MESSASFTGRLRDIYRIAKNCRTSVEMSEKHYVCASQEHAGCNHHQCAVPGKSLSGARAGRVACPM